ncbi:MAG: hypothetical protein JF888_07575 [Candidatus Dormibacteraeota bacterium]|uniref:Uncharacterized protein n=1 Tax=Candidatus Dormiibacter inghamiae TaxID=3127013 RepID=A0A934NDK8_9BACT|nr:hypothetical protein [Candidatus Dormibacteraeota bacterium]MBJ7606033.1 hypothetical protein [Candidatus Dormibacteraeota bacterium]
MSRIIDVRKLAALDLNFHEARFVLIEFAGAVVLAGGLGGLALRSSLSGPGHPVFWEIGVGVLLASIALNYLPLLIYAVVLIRSGTARQEVAAELDQAERSSVGMRPSSSCSLCRSPSWCSRWCRRSDACAGFLGSARPDDDPDPRHVELGERFAEEIFKECEGEFGTKWWRR